MTNENTSTTTTDSRLEDIPWRRVANVAGILLLVAVVIPFVVFAVPQVVGADQGYVVLSGSMEPAMSPGDAVIVNDVPASEIEQNDVITFGGQGDGTPTTHRVIEVVERDGTTAFRTKGDANEDPDATLVTPDQVQGKVMSLGGHLLVIPFIGYVINFAGTQSGFVLFFALPVMLFVLNEIWNVVTAARSTSGGGPAETSAGGGSTATTTDAAAAGAPEAPSTRPDGSGAPEATAQPGGAAADASTEDDAEISFTAAELQLGLGINAAFLAYSAWVVYSIWTTYDTVETWALGVAGGVGASFLLLGGLYVFGGGDGADATDEAASAEPASDPDPESEPDQTSLVSSDEATAEQNGTSPEETQESPEVNADASETDADASADTATHRTNGDGQPASSRSDGGEPAADTTTEGDADE